MIAPTGRSSPVGLAGHFAACYADVERGLLGIQAASERSERAKAQPAFEELAIERLRRGKIGAERFFNDEAPARAVLQVPNLRALLMRSPPIRGRGDFYRGEQGATPSC
jgi:hypothetical protein